jgi:hypothetical protein
MASTQAAAAEQFFPAVVPTVIFLSLFNKLIVGNVDDKLKRIGHLLS